MFYLAQILGDLTAEGLVSSESKIKLQGACGSILTGRNTIKTHLKVLSLCFCLIFMTTKLFFLQFKSIKMQLYSRLPLRFLERNQQHLKKLQNLSNIVVPWGRFICRKIASVHCFGLIIKGTSHFFAVLPTYLLLLTSVNSPSKRNLLHHRAHKAGASACWVQSCEHRCRSLASLAFLCASAMCL